MATNIAPKAFLSIFRWFAKIGVRNLLKSLVTGPILLVNCYLEIKFYKTIRVNPAPSSFIFILNELTE